MTMMSNLSAGNGSIEHIQNNQQQQSGAMETRNDNSSRSSSGADAEAEADADADALPWRIPSPARARGVRRRREDSIEIEELDSDTMRQNSYNYFQRYARTSVPAYNVSSSASSANVAFTYSGATGVTSPSFRVGSSRKRQRTLADRLEELCLGGNADYLDHRNSRSSSSVVADANMDGEDGADDDDNENEDDDDDRAENHSELMVYGGVPSMKGFFFGSARRKPMDRVFRHYAAVANQAASSAEPSGNEIVLFRRASQTSPSPLPTPYIVNLSSYLSLTPQELEALTRQEKSKRAAAAASVVVLSSSDDDSSDDAQQRRMPMTAGSSSSSGLSSTFKSAFRSRGSASASSTGSPPFHALGVPHTDAMEDLEDVDMEGEGDSRQPHLSGDVSHSEWFLDDGL